MHSFLVAQIDLPNSPDTLNIRPEKSLGISDVRTLQTFLTRKPIQSTHNTVLLHDAHLLTVPAQHALLKTLEEPPGDSLIYLVTTSPDELLPTILSRVQITSDQTPTPHEVDASITQIISTLLGTTSTKERLRLLEDQKFDRESAIEFIDQFELFMHHHIKNDTFKFSLSTFDLISQTRTYLRSNCNIKLTMDHLALHVGLE